jgi:hypothetical protein
MTTKTWVTPEIEVLSIEEVLDLADVKTAFAELNGSCVDNMDIDPKK